MQHETRNQFIERTISEFLESSETSTSMNLYSKEIRRIKRDYGDTVEVTKGPKTNASAEDKRYNCTICKK